MLVESGAKIGEGEREIVIFEHFVRDIGVPAGRHAAGLVAPEAAVAVAVVALSRHEVEKLAGVGGARARRVLNTRVQSQAVAGDLQQTPTGQHVKADSGDSVWRKALRDDAQKRLAQRFSNPAEDPVTDDEIERAIRGVDLIETAHAEVDVGQRKPRDALFALRDLHRRKVDADKLGVGPGGSERNDVAACSAPDLKDACSCY